MSAAILKCCWCGSKVMLDSDGDGHLTERLNHPCICTPRIAQPVVRKTKPRKPKPVRIHRCEVCQMEIHPNARFCAPHAKAHRQWRQREWHRHRIGTKP